MFYYVANKKIFIFIGWGSKRRRSARLGIRKLSSKSSTDQHVYALCDCQKYTHHIKYKDGPALRVEFHWQMWTGSKSQIRILYGEIVYL